MRAPVVVLQAFAVATLLAMSARVLSGCVTDPGDAPPTSPPCEWPAGRDMVDVRTGEKGVFLTEAEWQQLWDCRER